MHGERKIYTGFIPVLFAKFYVLLWQILVPAARHHLHPASGGNQEPRNLGSLARKRGKYNDSKKEKNRAWWFCLYSRLFTYSPFFSCV